MLYAHPHAIGAGQRDLPCIAIIVAGLGVSASGTAEAFAKLPAPTCRRLPRGPTRKSTKCCCKRRRNRSTTPTTIPARGRCSPTPEQNIDRLHWLMSRFSGYVGIIGYVGARFTASEPALTPVLRDTAIGLANALPATVAGIASWAKAIEQRVLVPVTILATKEKSS